MNYKAKTHFKAVFSFLAAFFLVLSLSGQAMVKGTGIRYYQGYTLATYPTATAPETTYGTEIAFFIDLNIFCKWDRVTSVWVPVDNILVQSGAPTHTPGVGDPVSYLDKDTGDFYKYDGTWGVAGGVPVTVSKIATVGDTSTLTPINGDIFVNAIGDTTGFYNTDRWQVATTRKIVVANVVYVDPNGNNAIAEKGRPDLPFADPWTATPNSDQNDLIQINQGFYTNTGNPNLWTSSTANRFKWDGIINVANLGAAQLLFQKQTDGDTLHVEGDEVRFNFDRLRLVQNLSTGSYFNGKFKRVLYDPASLATKNFGDIWNLGSNTDLVIDRLDNTPELGGYVGGNAADATISIKIGTVNFDPTATTHFQKVLFSVLSPAAGIALNTKIDVGQIVRPDNLATRAQSGFEYKLIDFRSSGTNIHQGTQIYNFGSISVDTTARDGTIGLFGTGTESRIRFEVASLNHHVSVSIDELIGDNTIRFEPTVTTDSSTFNFDFGKMDLKKRIFESSSATFSNETFINLDCESCIVENDLAIIISGATIDATSRATFSGYYETKEPGYPVIFTSQDIYLKDVILRNDGTVPSIRADVPVTVYVSGAFDMNTINLDPDITFTRLPEYGAIAGGSDGNGIFDAANNGSVLPVAAYTVNLFDATGQLQFLGSATGTAQSRILLNSTTAAGGTVIEDRDPGTPANAANLTLNWDGTSTLTTNDQSFDLSTGTASSNWTSSSLNFTGATDANLMTIRKAGPGELLKYKFDFGAGGGYQLAYEDDSGSPFTNRLIFDATGTNIRYGAGFTDFFIDTDLEHTAGESSEKIMVWDTITNQVKAMPLKMTGWAQYSSTTIDRTSPQTITNGATDTLTLELIPTDSIVFEMPVGFESLFSSTDTTILAPKSGDGYMLRLDFDTRSSTTDNYGVFLLDIGGSQGVIVERTISFPRGALVWARQSISFNYYTLSTFVANGGKMRFVAPDDNFDVANPTIVITKVHDGG